MSDKIKIIILDDHQMLIDGLKALLKTDKKIEVVGETTSASAAMEMAKKNSPDIILTDINMPEMSGIEFTQLLKKELPQVKVIALSMFGEKSTISDMLQAGASGYILKNTGKEELINAIEKVAAGGMFFSDEVSAEMMKAMSTQVQQQEKINFTEREKEIIKLITQEYSNAAIGEKLFISERTVETHRKNIFRKANTKTVVGLVKFAIEHQLI